MKRALLLITFLLFLLTGAVIPAYPSTARAMPVEKGTPTLKTTDPAVTPAILKIHNRPIVTLRGPLLGYTPKQRVEASEERIRRLIERGEMGAVSAVT
ncbi:MAG TPA: hypothetical protein PLR20_09995 [Syntrophales bacterium]|jgi:hypothetical protein|nr:hypothetical protein [Syntrophales bacterium]HPI57611.1 hypothetical protein [Syntrophales bacterium]HPN25376.1 hypothetical protein [Syntrophales bacterium]HQM29668.1 hypothetical protein [Syntrophales bacterium]